MIRRLLMPALLVLFALGIVPSAAGSASSAHAVRAGDPVGIQHIVVIYEENHSFDNLYGGWEGVNGLANADKAHTKQIDQAGNKYTCLMQDDVNLTSPPLSVKCTTPAFSSHFKNNPYSIEKYIPASATTCPPPGAPFQANGWLDGTGVAGGCTRDLVHRFYQEPYQLNNGAQNRYVTGSDAVGLSMGHYDTTRLPIYTYLHSLFHPRYAIEDNYFQGAFGGSFLNHQWLIAAATPKWPHALNDGSVDDLHSVLDVNGMPTSYPLYTSPQSSVVKDQALTQSCHPAPNRGAVQPGFVCGNYAVNTIQPFYQPYTPGTAVTRRLPPQTGTTIGDELSAAGVDWAWYSGGWSNADGDVGGPGWTNGNGPTCSDPRAMPTAVYPNCPDLLFQFHHQPFNYYASFAPGTPARTAHLQDEQAFQDLADSSLWHCNLKPVSFIKPIGAENEHPGYTGENRGSQHLVDLLKSIENTSCRFNTMVIVTYDEFGGQWDHVPPPGQGGTKGPHDKWGPGSRVPALVLSPFLEHRFVVDDAQHDTTSILATIERRFGLEPLGTRDAKVNDFSTIYHASTP